MPKCEVGKLNNLAVLKKREFGVYLDGYDLGEILLPTKYIPENCKEGDWVEVFVYYDSEDRLIATRENPKAMVGQFSTLQVVSLGKVGAFLDWGLSKDLFLPFSEQTREIKVGLSVVVYVYTDKSGRISSTMRLEKHLQKTPANFNPGDQVELLIYAYTDLGYKAIVNGTHTGMLFKNEVFKELKYGQYLPAFIKDVREDGKIDLTLLQPGHHAANDEIGPKILELLNQRGGFLDINDKTPAETIYRLFGVSKKKYKIALGGLYKKRLIRVTEEGIFKA